MTESMTVTVDTEACNGHGRCYMSAPDVFDCDDAGFPVVLGPATGAKQIADLERAVQNCPEHALSATRAE